MRRVYLIRNSRFELELHWKAAIYERDGVCKLKGAYFSGPALSEADKIKDNDSIMLDFFQQYYILVENVYVAKFSWGQVIYNKDNTVALKRTFITHDTEINRVPKLSDTDYLVIDTFNHETFSVQNVCYKC